MESLNTRALVVLPTYNERENLERVVAGILAQGCSVLVVDDNSPDGTGAIADRLAAAQPKVQVLHRPRKSGLGSAYVAGFERALALGFDFILEMDADGSHLPQYLDPLIAGAAETRGLAIGSRYVTGGSVVGWGFHRLLLSSGANVYTRMLLGMSIKDCTSGFRCYARNVLEQVRLEDIFSQGYAFQIEMLYRCFLLGTPVTEVPIRFEDRVEGQSKVSQSEIRRALMSVVQLRLRHLPRERPGDLPAHPLA